MVITSKTINAKNPVRYWILLGIAFISLMGTLLHFVYDWSGNLIIVGIFAPINESVWEHLKMAFWPTLIWWFSGYLFLEKNQKINGSQWIFSCTISALISPLFILTFYYTYTGALGIHSLFLDISSFFISVIVAQILALYVYSYDKIHHYWFYCSLTMLALITAAFIIYTFMPPHIPLFIDTSSGKFGI
ncbi:MAG: DUF6512 family protein [Bacillota bacterium]